MQQEITKNTERIIVKIFELLAKREQVQDEFMVGFLLQASLCTITKLCNPQKKSNVHENRYFISRKFFLISYSLYELFLINP